MRSFKVLPLLLLGILFLTAAVFAADQHKFIGVAACKMCHKAQYDVWAATKHAKALDSLKTEAAAKIAAEKKLAKPAAESDECLKCHTTAFGVDAALLDVKFDKAMGVQCEACHGAGGDYKSMPVMKDKAKAIAAGLTEYKDAAAIEAKCKTCHNEKSPTKKAFDFKTAWELIKHPVPKKG